MFFFDAFMRRHNASKNYERQRQQMKDFDAKVRRAYREKLAARILQGCKNDPEELERAYLRYEWLADIEQTLIQRTKPKN